MAIYKLKKTAYIKFVNITKIFKEIQLKTPPPLNVIIEIDQIQKQKMKFVGST